MHAGPRGADEAYPRAGKALRPTLLRWADLGLQRPLGVHQLRHKLLGKSLVVAPPACLSAPFVRRSEPAAGGCRPCGAPAALAVAQGHRGPQLAARAAGGSSGGPCAPRRAARHAGGGSSSRWRLSQGGQAAAAPGAPAGAAGGPAAERRRPREQCSLGMAGMTGHQLRRSCQYIGFAQPMGFCHFMRRLYVIAACYLPFHCNLRSLHGRGCALSCFSHCGVLLLLETASLGRCVVRGIGWLCWLRSAWDRKNREKVTMGSRTNERDSASG